MQKDKKNSFAYIKMVTTEIKTAGTVTINLFFIVGTILLLVSFFNSSGASKFTTSIFGYSFLIAATLVSMVFIRTFYSMSKFVYVIGAIIVFELLLLFYSLIITILYQKKLLSGNYDPHYDVLNQCFLFLILVLYGTTSQAFMFYKPHQLPGAAANVTQPIMNINTASMLSIIVTLGIITLVTMHRNLIYNTADG